MKKIAILSRYSGINNRGVESWAEDVKSHVNEFQIDINPKDWFNYDIVIQTNGKLMALFSRIVCWVMHRPLVIFGHSGLGADDKWNLLCCPDTFVAFTHVQARWAEKFKLPWTKVEVISHAVDIDIFKPGRPVTHNIVLCVAANTPAKRTDLLVAAQKMIPGSKLILIGPGQPLQIPHSQITDYYQTAKIFCFPTSPWESFGIVLLEAMASGLGIVATDDPIRREIVGEAGFFVDPTDTKKLADTISKALSKKWGNIPRKRAELFSWDKIALQYDQLFKKICSQ